MRLLNLLGIGNKRKEMIDKALEKGAIILDVRTVAEFNRGHVPGSINIPLNQLGTEVPRIQKMNKTILTCCASGMRSASATAMLKAKGIDCINAGSWTALNR